MTKKTTSTLTRFTQSLGFSIVLGAALCSRVYGQDTSGFNRIAWEHGPVVTRVGDQATMNLPEGFVFTHAADATKFLELTQNPPSGRELGILAPEDLSWFAILSFSDVGYVRDDDKDSLDADAILASIQQGTEESNKERKRLGWSTISVVGWIRPPHYDSRTRNLEWGLKGRDENGQVVVNYYTRLLGRRGVLTVDFVAGVDGFETRLVAFQQAMQSFNYTPPNNYLAFVPGDKVAQCGLTGLIVGGATAVGVQTGLFKFLWKVIVAAVAGIGAILKKLFSRCQDRAVQVDRQFTGVS